MGERLKVQRGTTEEKSIGQLLHQFIVTPELQTKVAISPLLAAGATVTAWYRGGLTGVYDSYLTLRDAYPEAAEALIDAFDMDADGVIVLG